MSGVSDFLKAVKDIVLLSHKIEETANIAREANQRSLENRDRIGRIETALMFIIKEQDAQRRLPPH